MHSTDDRKQVIPGSVILTALLLVFFSCHHPRPVEESKSNFRMMDDTILKYNKALSENEEEQIDAFIERYGWEMRKTSTGLRYMIYRQGSGPRAQKGKTAVLQYEIRLLNGNLCYSSDHDGLKEVFLGHSSSERGLEEGILLMKVGDRAKLIVPSHLAFGLLGDEKRIPRQATLVYDITFIQLK